MISLYKNVTKSLEQMIFNLPKYAASVLGLGSYVLSTNTFETFAG